MKDTDRKGLWLFVLLVTFSCKHKQADLTIKIEKSFISYAVSSGSGLAILSDSIFIIGDDAEYIGNLSIVDSQYRKIEFYPNALKNRIDRSIKHDLESGTTGIIGNVKFLFAFGSGSISPFRDTLFALNVNDYSKCIRRSLSSLYSAVRLKGGLKENELNIEGATVAGDKLILLNRGKNFLIVVAWQEFVRYVLEQNPSGPPPFSILHISLPEINNFQVGFSGACTLNESELLFTASLEETKDFTKDGAIKGSYVGILKLVNDTTVSLASFTNLKNHAGNIVLDKLESIEVLKMERNTIKSIAVADNDDGSSKVFYLNIKRH